MPPGDCGALQWHVAGGDWPVLLNGKEVPPGGEGKVCPKETTTYELVVELPDGPSRARQVTLYVVRNWGGGTDRMSRVPKGRSFIFGS